MSDVYLKQLQLGPMKNFVYLLGSRSARQCYAVDPAWDIDAVLAAAQADNMTIVGALVTHYHPDHCGGHLWGHDIEGVAELTGKIGGPVYAHVDEVDGIAKITGLSKTDLTPTRSGDVLTLGGCRITMLHTPGHTPGSQCFLCDDRLVAGDTLFISGCGRVDLPGGSAEQLFESLNKKLATLPAATILYPGHHYDPAHSMPLADVKRQNPYLAAGSLNEFLRFRGRS